MPSVPHVLQKEAYLKLCSSPRSVELYSNVLMILFYPSLNTFILCDIRSLGHLSELGGTTPFIIKRKSHS